MKHRVKVEVARIENVWIITRRVENSRHDLTANSISFSRRGAGEQQTAAFFERNDPIQADVIAGRVKIPRGSS